MALRRGSLAFLFLFLILLSFFCQHLVVEAPSSLSSSSLSLSSHGEECECDECKTVASWMDKIENSPRPTPSPSPPEGAENAETPASSATTKVEENGDVPVFDMEIFIGDVKHFYNTVKEIFAHLEKAMVCESLVDRAYHLIEMGYNVWLVLEGLFGVDKWETVELLKTYFREKDPPVHCPECAYLKEVLEMPNDEGLAYGSPDEIKEARMWAAGAMEDQRREVQRHRVLAGREERAARKNKRYQIRVRFPRKLTNS